jgi:tetratricopeptide (TPR) repeat protein
MTSEDLVIQEGNGREDITTIGEDLAIAISRAASAALLRIGRIYEEQGMLYHALSPYLKIVSCYPENGEAPAAVDRLVAIAEIFEGKRQYHMALSVYDRLERAARFRRWNGHQVSPDGDIL